MYDKTEIIEGIDEFKNAYEIYRNLHPKIRKENIKKYEINTGLVRKKQMIWLNFIKNAVIVIIEIVGM